jgi:hypothetical protein
MHYHHKPYLIQTVERNDDKVGLVSSFAESYAELCRLLQLTMQSSHKFHLKNYKLSCHYAGHIPVNLHTSDRL